MSDVIVVGFIYYFKNLKVLWSLFINAVKYMACSQIFYLVFNAHPAKLNYFLLLDFQMPSFIPPFHHAWYSKMLADNIPDDITS